MRARGAEEGLPLSTWDMPVKPQTDHATLLRRRNVSVVLRTVLTDGPLPRVEIVESTSLSGGSVTRITSELMREGIVRQLPGASGGRQGAPRVPLELCAEDFLALGVHLGQRRANVGLVDLRGRVLDRHAARYDDTDPRRVVDQAAGAARELLERQSRAARLVGTGLSVGGWVDTDRGVVVENPGLGWREVPLRELAASQFPASVAVDGTYQALARAQLIFDVAPRPRDFLLLFLGNVIGAGIVVDGKIQDGARAAAGNVAHLPVSGKGEPCPECGRRNCLLAVAGDRAVLDGAVRLGLLSPDASDEQLLEFVANDRDPGMTRILHARARAVGEVVTMLVDILDPEQVMLADPMLDVPDYMRILKATAAKRRPGSVASERLVRVSTEPVVPAATGALDTFYEDPLTGAANSRTLGKSSVRT